MLVHGKYTLLDEHNLDVYTYTRKLNGKSFLVLLNRNYLGHVSAMVNEMNQRELALGTQSRSGDQFDVWEAVFSPMARDGYPMRIFDKYTGAIDSSVAAYRKEHFDLTHIIKCDWPIIGAKLQGKIHIYVGDMDNYYLNNAVTVQRTCLKTTGTCLQLRSRLWRPSGTLLERRSYAA